MPLLVLTPELRDHLQFLTTVDKDGPQRAHVCASISGTP